MKMIATAAALMANTASADLAGYVPLTIEAPHHGRDMLGALWYPADAGGRAFTFAENGVFEGVEVVEEARIAQGQFPVVVLSHGMGGNIRSLAWLAAGLAERGAIVVSMNHPNSTWGDFDMAQGLQHWTRVQDMSLALDTVLADPHLQGRIDETRIMAAGFSYGGWSALSMGGLRADHAGYVAHCDSYGSASSHCDDLMGEGIRIMDVEADQWNASYADARVTHVMAMDPGMIWGLDPSDAADVIESVTLIGLGAEGDQMLATDFEASGLVDLLPQAEVLRIAPAFHFTALPLCKPMGPAILEEEGDDPVCSDPEGTDRAVVHQRIIDQMSDDLGL